MDQKNVKPAPPFLFPASILVNLLPLWAVIFRDWKFTFVVLIFGIEICINLVFSSFKIASAKNVSLETISTENPIWGIENKTISGYKTRNIINNIIISLVFYSGLMILFLFMTDHLLTLYTITVPKLYENSLYFYLTILGILIYHSLEFVFYFDRTKNFQIDINTLLKWESSKNAILLIIAIILGRYIFDFLNLFLLIDLKKTTIIISSIFICLKIFFDNIVIVDKNNKFLI